MMSDFGNVYEIFFTPASGDDLRDWFAVIDVETFATWHFEFA